MAFEVILNGQITNGGGAVSGISVNLNVVKEQNTITGYRNTANVFTTTSDAGGRVQFSGVTAGLYDIQAVSGTNNYYMYNYQVKNSYTVPVGDSASIEESRTFIRSSESLAPSGIMVSDSYRPQVQIGMRLDPHVDSNIILASGSSLFYNRLDESVFSISVISGRETDVYYRGNQNVKLSQSFTLKLP